MILDSMKTRGFYAFFNGMKFSGTLGLYLVALFMCLGFEVKAVELPSYAICHNGWQNVDETISVAGHISTTIQRKSDEIEVV